jgi:flavin reductase (DIM6/NTAB) family NADH-FMN oxidoreductase RutF
MSAVIGCSDDVRGDFRTAMRGVAATVTIVTAANSRLCHGMTATAVTSLSMDPPSLLVCVNRNTLLHEILLTTARFCVNVLRGYHADLSAAFSGAVSPQERFQRGTWAYTADGIAYLTDAQANVLCRKVALIPYATHTIFIGEAETVELRPAAEPLIYHNATYCVSVPARSGERSGQVGVLSGEG